MVSVSLYAGIAASTGSGVDSRHRVDIDDVGIAVTERLPAGVYVDRESTFDRHELPPTSVRAGGGLVSGRLIDKRIVDLHLDPVERDNRLHRPAGPAFFEIEDAQNL